MGAHLRTAVVGSTGYGGVELIRLLQNHPRAEITSVISSSHAGEPLTADYPHLHGIVTHMLDPVDPDLIRDKADVVFTATPSGVSAKIVPQLLEAGLKVIDLSGDFRLRSGALYEQWYKKQAADDSYLQRAVYGLCELFGEEARGADFISNPGCYPTAALLGIAPLVKSGWIDPDSVIIDAKSGVSGAGRGVSLGVHFAEVNENLKAYKVNEHQHIPEIEQALSRMCGKEITVSFTTHLVPMTRGIMCTAYANLSESINTEELVAFYRQFYEGRRFVRIRDAGRWPATKEVWGSNYCDIGVAVDSRTNRVTIVSVIDNVVKGAAGQAVQNMNLMMGWQEELGLELLPVYP